MIRPVALGVPATETIHTAKTDNPGVRFGVETSTVRALTLLKRAMEEQRSRAETVRRLLKSYDEHQARLDHELLLALRAVGQTPPKSEPSAVRNSLRASAEMPRALVRCFGSLDVTIGDTRIESWRSGKARVLFEYLVTHRGRAVSREALIEALWPDPDALAAGTSLKVAVHALRQILAETGVPGDTPLTVVVRESNYELHASNIWIDVEEFERLCRLGSQLSSRGDHGAALACFEQAVELYTGDFLEDTWDDWAVFRREGLKDQYLFVLAQLADAAFRAGNFQRCIQFSQQLLEKDNCREDTYRTLMICHARLGQFGRVRRWYELCVQTLRTVLEIGPSRETEEVYWQTQREPGRTTAINRSVTNA